MSSGALIRGSGITNTIIFLKSKYGIPALNEILSVMPEPSRLAMSTILSNGWYPVEQIGDLLSAMKTTIGTGKPDFLYTVSIDTAKTNFNVVYKVFLKIGSPSYVVNKIISVWSTLSNKGNLTVVDKSNNHIIMRLTGFPYINADYCSERLRGCFSAPLELSGCTVTKASHTACTSKGDPYCEWKYSWV